MTGPAAALPGAWRRWVSAALPWVFVLRNEKAARLRGFLHRMMADISA
jgi:hypothetical protein